MNTLGYLMVKPDIFSLFFLHNVADSTFSFLTVMFLNCLQSSVLLGIQMRASCFKLKMGNILIIEKLHKFINFEMLTLQNFSQKYIKQTLHKDILLSAFEIFIKVGLWAKHIFTKQIILF